MSDIVEPGGPEFRTDNINTLGQFLKVATHIEKRAFPKQVILPKAGFFQECYRRVFLGGGNPSIEHMALVGVNDVGEILLGKEVFDGTEHFALSDKSKQAYYDLESLSRKIFFHLGGKL